MQRLPRSNLYLGQNTSSVVIFPLADFGLGVFGVAFAAGMAGTVYGIASLLKACLLFYLPCVANIAPPYLGQAIIGVDTYRTIEPFLNLHKTICITGTIVGVS